MAMKKTTRKKKTDDNLLNWVKKSIDLLIHNSLSDTVILSSYKLHTVMRDNYGVNLRVDRVGRALSKYAKQKNLKRLGTNIPKYRLSISDYVENEKKEQSQKNLKKKTLDNKELPDKQVNKD